ncbi:ParB/RepB/Spo0J family partition protein [Thermaurantiacus sp.]
MKKPHGLGKGLAALLDEMGARVPEGRAGGPEMVPIDLIDRNPNQPRRHFDEAALEELAQSIRTQGILQPLLLRPRGEGRYEIVAGERRWRAAQRAGLAEVPAIVRALDDRQVFEAALIENVQRTDLNPIEEADAYGRLRDEFAHTQERIAEVTGKSRSHIGNYLRLLELPPAARAMVADGRLSMGHAKVVLASANPGELALEIVEKGLSVRQAEARVLAERRALVPKARGRRVDPDAEALEAQLAEATGLQVRLKTGPGWGELRFRYTTLDQLDQLIARLGV